MRLYETHDRAMQYFMLKYHLSHDDAEKFASLARAEGYIQTLRE